MTKYYCDYCDIFLTHDAPRVRRDHNTGWKHQIQVRAHFLAMNQDKMLRTVGEIVKDYGMRGELVPVPTPANTGMPAPVPFMNNTGQRGASPRMPPHPSPPTYNNQNQQHRNRF